jgi:hypothetical protein
VAGVAVVARVAAGPGRRIVAAMPLVVAVVVAGARSSFGEGLAPVPASVTRGVRFVRLREGRRTPASTRPVPGVRSRVGHLVIVCIALRTCGRIVNASPSLKTLHDLRSYGAPPPPGKARRAPRGVIAVKPETLQP